MYWLKFLFKFSRSYARKQGGVFVNTVYKQFLSQIQPSSFYASSTSFWNVVY